MSGKSLLELLIDFLDQMRSRRFSRYTVRQNRYGTFAFLRWLADTHGVTMPERLRRSHLEAWQKHVAAQTLKGQPLKPRTVNKYLETARNFLRYLGGQGYAARHLELALQYVKEPQVLPTSVLTHSQARRLLEHLATDTPPGYRNRTLLELLYTSGIRAGELVGLDVGHVDFANATARVTGKGQKERVVPIGRTALQFLQNYVRGVRPFLLRDPAERALFLDEQGKRLPYHTLRRLVHACAERAGVAVNVTPHTFRRSCTTELIRGGAGLYQVKELLGHERLDTIQHYAKLTIHDLKKEHRRCHPREEDGCGQEENGTTVC